MGRKKTWGAVEEQFITENASTMKDEELAKALSALVGRNVSIQSIRKQRQKLGIYKLSGRGRCGLRPTQSIPVVPVATPTVNSPVDSLISDGSVEVSMDNNVEQGGTFLFTPGQ